MNHQVEDDVDVEAAVRECAEPMDLDESRIDEQRSRGFDGGIEPFRLSNRQRDVGRRGGGNHLVRLSERSGHRFLDEHGNAGLEKRQRDVAMQLGRTAIVTAHPPFHDEVARVEQRRALTDRAISSARARLVSTTAPVRPRQRREDPRVVPPEVADADDGDAKTHARPTIAMPASSAALMIASPSIISVLPASTDNAVAPAARIASIVATPMTGTSNRMS